MAKKTIGEANIKITADGAEQVKAQLDDIKGKTEEVANSGTSMGGRLDGAFGKVGQSIEDSTKGLRKFQGAITGIIGVVGGLAAIGVGAFKKITSEIQQAKEAADSFNNSLRDVRSVGEEAVRSVSGFGDTGDALSQLTQQVAQQRRAIGDATARAIADAQKKYEEANPFNPLAEKKARQQLEEDLAEIAANERRQLQRLNEAATKKEAEVAAKIEEDRLAEIGRIQDAKEKEITDRTRELRLSVLDDVGRAEEELAFKRRQIENDIAEAGSDDRRVSQLREILALETQIGQAKIDAARKAREEESKRAEDRAASMLAKQMAELAKKVDEQVKALNDNTKTQEQLLRQVTIFTPDIRRAGDGLAGR